MLVAKRWTRLSDLAQIFFIKLLSIFGCKEYNQFDFGIDHLVMSMYRVFSCVIGRGCLLWPVHSLGKTLISLCPASCYTPRPNLPVTPGMSWLPTFAFLSPIMKRTSFLGVGSKRSCRSSSVSSVHSLSRVQLCDPMNRSMPCLPLHHQLPEFTQTHVHRVCDAIQPSHPLSSPSPPAPNPSQHQNLFQWVNPLHEVAKVLEFQL